jgi:hypothetical protein
VVRKSRAALPSLPALTLGVAEVVLHGIGGRILRGREALSGERDSRFHRGELCARAPRDWWQMCGDSPRLPGE